MRSIRSFAASVFVVIVAIGMALSLTMYSLSASWTSNWLVIAAVKVDLVVAFAIKVADQWDRAVVLRLGRFRALKGPTSRSLSPFPIGSTPG